MTMTNIFFALFVLALIGNAIALVRHWRALQAFRIALNNLNATQAQFNEIMEAEQRKKS